MPRERQPNIEDVLVSFINNAQIHGMDKTVKEVLSIPGSYSARRKVVAFIAKLRGHRIGTYHEMPTGVAAKCECCEMLVKVPRVFTGVAAAQGRALDYDCPSAPCAGAVRTVTP